MPSLAEFDAACAIGEKLIEMADRLKPVDGVVPGSQAKWAFEMDDVRYGVVMAVARR